MKHYCIFFTFLTFIFIYGCSSTKQSIPAQGTIAGRIFVIGNEPFTKLAIQTSQGIMYPLKCEKKIGLELRKKQGHLVKIHYEGIEESPEGRTLKVLKAEISN